VTQTNIDRLSNGLDKLMKTQKDVDILVEQAKVKAVEAGTCTHPLLGST